VDEIVRVREKFLSDEDISEGEFIDSLSGVMVMNHNCEVLFNMVRQANELYEKGENLPTDLSYFKQEIAPEIFNSENPMSTITKHQKTLKQLKVQQEIYRPESHPLIDMPERDYQPDWS